MKRCNKLLSFILAVMMLFVFASCENSDEGDNDKKVDVGEYVMRLGDHTVSEADYMYLLSYVKDRVVYNQQSYLYQYTGTVYDEADILAMPAGDDITVAEYIEDYATELAQQMMIIEKLCADAKIDITNQEDLDTISDYIADIEYAYGGEDLFGVALSRLGFSKSGIERFQRFSVLYDLLYDYRYGENGVVKVSEEQVYETFMKNYMKYDGILFSYVDEAGSDIVFEYSDEAISDYFYNNYVKVRHILYKTVDSSYKKLSDEVVAEKKSKAESALAAITSGEKTFDDFKADTEDSGLEYTFTYGQMVEAFEKASFEMNVGDFRVVETEYGYHLIEKLSLNDEDLNGTKGEDGKTTGGVRTKVISAMTVADIRAEALDTLKKLQNKELEKYPDENNDKKYYFHMDSGIVDTTDYNNQVLVELLKDIENETFIEKEFAGDATYILRKLSFTREDITSEIYSAIEEKLAVESLAEYTQAYYDDISINKELLEKFDAVTIPILEKEFYVEN